MRMLIPHASLFVRAVDLQIKAANESEHANARRMLGGSK